jgi:hypothetical protein
MGYDPSLCIILEISGFVSSCDNIESYLYINTMRSVKIDGAYISHAHR